MSEQNLQADVVVLGSGPGGYTAAFRLADLGKQVILIEQYSQLGGVCLNVGCIPSKALLHAAKVIDDAKHMQQHGIDFADISVDPKKIVAWKSKVVNKLVGGLSMLAKQRKVKVVNGYGKFLDPNTIVVDDNIKIKFQQAIIAVGSRPVKLPFIPEDERIFTSTKALDCKNISGSMLIIGGGIIGLEMATVYASFGMDITIVEMADQLIPGADSDLVKHYLKYNKDKFKHIHLQTKVTKVVAADAGIEVTFVDQQEQSFSEQFDNVLVAVGRVPNGKLIAAEQAGVIVDDAGFISVNSQMQTNVEHIYAIGDVVGQPMLAHKAIPEGKIAAEVIAGKKHYFDPISIPSVAYTDPEIAWAGVTEAQAKQEGLDYGVGAFPWAASGKSLTHNRDEGLTKLIFDKSTNIIIGAGIVGSNAGDLIAEAMLAIEMGCNAEDLSLTIHPHPTFAETIAAATEMYEGTITDLISPNLKK